MRHDHGFLVTAGFALGLVATACAAREAEEACEEYREAVAACPNVDVSFPKVSCDEARAKDREYFECLASWAQDGCPANDLADCTPG